MDALVICFLLIVTPAVVSRHVPRYNDLDDDEQHLYRAAYDTPSYDHEDYEEEEDLHLGKLDLVKDSLWALKAKIKEIKAFNKAMAAHMLSTKLKLKDLLKNHLAPIKTHYHEKPYTYQAPSYQAPHYPPPPHAEQQYVVSEAQYPLPPAQYPLPPAHQYNPNALPHDPYYGN